MTLPINTTPIIIHAITIFIASTLRIASAQEAEPSSTNATSESQLDANWNRTVEIPAVSFNGAVEVQAAIVRLSVEQGWLVVRRALKSGEVEWQVVLAQVNNDQPPRIEVIPEVGSFALSYGPYFIRENASVLRILRERKTADSPPYPKLFAEQEPQVMGSASSILSDIRGYRSKGWIWAESGLRERYDIVLRLTSSELSGNGTGFVGRQQLREMYYGDARAYDEGDLFTAKRITLEENVTLERAKKLRKPGQAAPPLVMLKTFNGPADINLEAMRGKVVLLDFWGTWCTPCVQNLPHVQEIATKFKDQGLVVIGVHTPQGSENLDVFLKKKGIDFPVVLDKGDTARAYGVQGWPTYFLIDKAGKIAFGGRLSGPPTDEQIEKLLK